MPTTSLALFFLTSNPPQKLRSSSPTPYEQLVVRTARGWGGPAARGVGISDATRALNRLSRCVFLFLSLRYVVYESDPFGKKDGFGQGGFLQTQAVQPSYSVARLSMDVASLIT